MLRLELTFPGLTFCFYPPHDPAPGGAALAFPWLASVDGINELANASLVAGMSRGEAASLNVALDNTANQAADLLGLPLRVPAALFDGSVEIFSGIVARVAPGLEFAIVIEA